IVSHCIEPGLNNNLDGPGKRTTWHCGPAFIQTVGNTLFLSAIDSNSIRRWQDGRVATLFSDGEWREIPTKTTAWSMRYHGYWPAHFGLPYIYIFDPGEGHQGDCRAYLFGPVDFTKPTLSSNSIKK
ncbi:MAG: hypothetical protein NZ700_01935, partial [Gemmataceae bacterium]|nr:hypothetical protein [Gemmataceae bacterium]